MKIYAPFFFFFYRFKLDFVLKSNSKHTRITNTDVRVVMAVRSISVQGRVSHNYIMSPTCV